MVAARGIIVGEHSGHKSGQALETKKSMNTGTADNALLPDYLLLLTDERREGCQYLRQRILVDIFAPRLQDPPEFRSRPRPS
jgi:hypothetical protein